MYIDDKLFDFDNNAYIMGILNVTPDSFSDGGRFNTLDKALYRTEEMIAQGAAVIDVGGESTRPGYVQISEEEETERVVPIIEAIKARFNIPVSLDTYKSRVAKAGIEAGAGLINDIWGLKYDPAMAGLVAEKKVACCIMHNRDNTDYINFIEDVISDLNESIRIAKEAGIEDDRIIIDPGVGFAKSYEQNLEIINKCDCLLSTGYPVLLGTSRKSVVGLTLSKPAQERVYGTIATTVIGYERGCRMFRVHDVKENLDALKMAEALMHV